MNAAAYLDADASALADREHTNTSTNTNTLHQVRRRALTDAALTEVEYARDLIRRAEKALTDEIAILRGLDLDIDWNSVQGACSTLTKAAVLLHIRALLERERRSA